MSTIDNLSPQKRELYELLLKQKRDQKGTNGRIPRRSGMSNSSPLSFAQQRLWFLDQLEPGNPYYNLAAAARLEGKFDAQSLELALSEIVRRHESLRTTINIVDDQAMQIIAPNRQVALVVLDISMMTMVERDHEIYQLAMKEAKRPFDLTQGPLLRATLFRSSDFDHTLLLVMHHIVSDGWSMGVLMDEITILYTVYSQKIDSSLPDLPIQYADFAIWQREWLQGEVLNTQLAYWKKQLSGISPVLDLPTDRPRPLTQSLKGDQQILIISKPLTDQLRLLSREENASLFMTLLIAFQALLSYYSGSTDIVVGTDVANRNRGETEALIGFFVNQLVMRGSLSGNPSFRKLLQHTRETCLEAYANQDAPFEKVVETINPERSLSHTPLFQVKLLLQNAAARKEYPETQDLKLSRLNIGTETSRFDLVFSMSEINDEIIGLVEYATDLYDSNTIDRMLKHYLTLLEGVVVDPDILLSNFPFLTVEEHRQLLVEWNSTSSGSELDCCVHHLFEAQADLTPNAIAVIYQDQELTYRDLNYRANKLAHYLCKVGVRPNVLVGVFLERSLDIVIGMLGVLKAGGAYLPLDISYPKSRLEQMMDDAQPPIMLTRESLGDDLPDYGAVVVNVDADSEKIKVMSEGNLFSGVTIDHLCYIVYTSGSTGRPKGVLINHQALTNRISSLTKVFGLSSEHRLMHCLPFSFDASVESLYTALASGASLILSMPPAQTHPREFLQESKRFGATALQLAPSYWGQIVDYLTLSNQLVPEWLKLFMTGGERISMEKMACWARMHRSQTWYFNSYGPAEATITATIFKKQLNAESIESNGWLSIGRPIANTQIYILDALKRPLPVGMQGEIYIGGMSLSWGYLNDPEKTAEKFMPDPFSYLPGARMYKTGDLARFLSDGNLDFLGRVDHQVKIRGFRIDPREIEVALKLHQEVSEVAAIGSKDVQGGERIVAYVTTKSDITPGNDDLREFLKQKLPDYMIPSAFIFLDQMPLMSSGKTDYSALPAPDNVKAKFENLFVAPGNPIEETLASIWSKVLGVRQISIHDTFFSLGGDSIRSIQVITLAEQSGLKFSLQQLFQYQTIYELARNISSSESPTLKSPISQPFSLISPADRRLLPADVEDAYPLAMAQLGMIYHSEDRADIYHSIVSQHLRASIDLEALRTALSQLIDSHSILRTSFDLTTYSEPLQLVHRYVAVPLNVEDLRQLQSEMQEQLITEWVEKEKRRYFDWNCAPLIHFQVHLRSDDTFQFTFSAPHAILDGWSDGLLFTELLKRYLMLLKREDIALDPAPTVTYRDYVALERATLASDEARVFWREKLQGADAMRHPYRPAVSKIDEGDSIYDLTYETSSEVFEGLQKLAELAVVPIKSTLLTAHLKVMSLIHSRHDVLTGMVLNGRPEEGGGERILGLFLNTVPFRFNLTGDSWVKLVRRVFDTEQELLPFRRYPLAQIQNELDGQTLFNSYFDFTHFHIYESISDIKDVEVLGGAGNSATNYTIAAFFNLNLSNSQVKLSLSIDTNKIDKQQAKRILGYYSDTFAAMATLPQGRHETTCLLSLHELRQLEKWNKTAYNYPGEKLLHEMFEEQVGRTPDQTALIFEKQSLSYRELNRRANQLAHHMKKRGVGSEILVGLCLERSVEMVVAMLGVLKAGGAYLPLDPEYPDERLSLMLKDAGVTKVLTVESIREKMAAVGLWEDKEVVSLDVDWEIISQEPSYDLSLITNNDNLAYVIFTSGSTGKPKGVMISHRAIVNHMCWMNSVYPLTLMDRVLHKTPFSFDASVWEFYAPLIAGARLIIARPGGHQNISYLINSIIEQQVTVLQVVPIMLQLLIDDPRIKLLKSIRRVFCGGETLSSELVTRFEQFLHAELYNLYGPTETTIDATSWNCREFSGNGSAPIGKPISNMQAYILDEFLQLVPVGGAGELFLYGDGLARGYMNRPELTAQKFIPNPINPKPGACLYRTGDWVRYLPGGEIEFIGRRDYQVKIRGFRIELGEIEAVLSTHDDIQSAIIVAQEDDSEVKQLAAYVVSRITPPQLVRNCVNI